jgi:hypothetical protein
MGVETTTGGAGAAPQQSETDTSERASSTGAAAGSQPDASAADQTTGEKAPKTGGLASLFLQSQPDATASAADAKGNTGSEQTTVTLPSWTSQLPKELLRDPSAAAKFAPFKALGDLAQAYLDTQGRQTVPAAGAPAEEVEAFYQGLGKPKSAEGYSFAKAEPASAQAAFAANLTSAQADAMYKASLAQVEALKAQTQAAVQKDLIASDTMLQKEYGDKYDEAVALFKRGLGDTGEKSSPIAQALIASGLLGKPEIVRAFIELGRATSEGSAPMGGAKPKGKPKSVFDGAGFAYKETY